MSEATKTRDFLKSVKVKWSTSFAFKVNDRSTSGIPDAILVINGRTIWVEFKKCHPLDVAKAVRPLQKEMLRRLHLSGAVALVLVFAPGRNEFLYTHDLSIIGGGPKGSALTLLETRYVVA